MGASEEGFWEAEWPVGLVKNILGELHGLLTWLRVFGSVVITRGEASSHSSERE